MGSVAVNLCEGLIETLDAWIQWIYGLLQTFIILMSKMLRCERGLIDFRSFYLFEISFVGFCWSASVVVENYGNTAG